MAINYADPNEWCSMFNNWEYMSLKEGLRLENEFHLITLSNWTKLKYQFGGGPEIPFFSYSTEVEKTNDDGSLCYVRESRHDFRPIRVRAHIIKRDYEGHDQAITLLISRHQTHNQFRNYLT